MILVISVDNVVDASARLFGCGILVKFPAGGIGERKRALLR